MQANTLSTRAAARRAGRAARQPRYKVHTGLALIAPWLLGLLLFKLLPILASLVISLTDLHLLESAETSYIGAGNYLAVLDDPQARRVFLETFRLALIVIPLQTAASILVAALLSNRRLLMKNTMRVLFFFPSIIPAAAATFMWRGFFNPDSGWAGRLLLGPLGLEDLALLFVWGPPEAIVILGSLWTIGPGILIMMGAMQGIHPEIYEAAQIDGAGALRRFTAMTIPLISPAIFFSLIINLTAIFGGALLLDRGYTFSTQFSSYDQYVNYQLFILFEMGYASGLAWVFFAAVMIVVMLLFATSKRWVYFPDRDA